MIAQRGKTKACWFYIGFLRRELSGSINYRQIGLCVKGWVGIEFRRLARAIA